MADLLVVEGGAQPDIRMLAVDEPLPMAGHLAMQSMPAIYDLIRQHRTTLVFVNTRMQAEYVFQALWNLNDDGLADRPPPRLARRRAAAPRRGGDGRGQAQGRGLHLDPRPRRRLGRRRPRRQRRRAEGRLAGSCSASAARTTAWTSRRRPILVPANRFEILECRAALDAVHEAAQDTPGRPPRGARRALPARPRHGLRRAVRRGRALRRGALRRALWLDWRARISSDVVAFVATGGYALRAYERFAKIRHGPDGLWRVRDGRVAQQYRLNVGTIIEATMIKVRLGRGARGKPGTVAPARRAHARRDRGVFRRDHDGRRHLLLRRRGAALRGHPRGRGARRRARRPAPTPRSRPTRAASSRSRPSSPSASAASSPTRSSGTGCRRSSSSWLLWQRRRSVLPGRRDLLVETFPRAQPPLPRLLPLRGPARPPDARHAADPPARAGGPQALRLRRQRLRARRLGDGRHRPPAPRPSRGFLDELFAEDMLGDDLEDWLAESALMKRTFRACAIIAGLIERRYPGQEKTRRQVTDVDRPRLRRAAQARAATTCSCGRRAPMRQRDSST